MDILLWHIRHAHNLLRIPGARFLRCESGVTAVEYGLIVSLVSVSLVAGATVVGSTLNDYFQMLADYF